MTTNEYKTTIKIHEHIMFLITAKGEESAGICDRASPQSGHKPLFLVQTKSLNNPNQRGP